MKTSDILRRAGQNLRQAKVRTVLTSLAIGVGAFTIALAMAAGMGGRAYTDEMIQTSGDAYSLSVYPKADAVQKKTTGLPEYGVDTEEVSVDSNSMTSRDIEAIKGVDGVESIRPMLTIDPTYVSRGENQKRLVAPVSVKVDRTDIKLAAGSLTDNMPKAGEVILPEGYLTSFGFTDAESALGQKLYIAVATNGEEEPQIREFPFAIVAVDKPTDTSLYYQEAVRVSSEDSVAMYTYQHGEAANEQYYAITVLVRQGADVAAVQKALKDEGYIVYSLQDTREALLQMVNIAQWGLAGFGALAILASIFGIINTQYISVLERTQQIGLMKALGARRRDISRLFRYEAAWIGFLGGLVGVVLAFLVTLTNPLITEVLSIEEGTRLLRMDWISSLILIGSLMLVAVLSGYFPARRAARLDPIEALRTE